MNTPAKRIVPVSQPDPREAAAELAAVHKDELSWLDAFSEQLDRCRAGQSFARALTVWGLNQSHAARLFGVSRQAVSKWMTDGIPAERAGEIADLAAATDLLVRYVQRDRIPAVVRRPIAARGDQSLLDLLAGVRNSGLLETCRAMFDFDRAQSGQRAG